MRSRPPVVHDDKFASSQLRFEAAGHVSRGEQPSVLVREHPDEHRALPHAHAHILCSVLKVTKKDGAAEQRDRK